MSCHCHLVPEFIKDKRRFLQVGDWDWGGFFGIVRIADPLAQCV